MPGSRSLVYRYVGLDCDKDISSDLVELSMDQVVWVTAAHVPPSLSAQAAYLLANPLSFGTRYWVQVLSGPGQAIDPPYGDSILHGRVTDNPEIPYFAWPLNVPND